MIEVEKKFILTPEQEARLLEDAEFVGEKTFTDAYYDNAQFSLSTQDIWLRSRDYRWELKLPMHQNGDKRLDQYQEIEGEMAIREIFAIPVQKSFAEDITALGHAVYCQCTSTRRKYKKEGFVLDLDAVQYEDFSYRIGEIELLVETPEEVVGAVKKIEEFAAAHGRLVVAPVRGKVIEYLRRKNPAHYKALGEAGILEGEEY